MSESAVVEATPTPEVPVFDVSRGPLVDITPEQRAEFRKTGNLPKTEEAAPSSEAKPIEAEAKPAGDSEPPTVQEPPKAKPKQTAEERIAQLEATIEKIRKGAGKETPKQAEPSPAPPKPVAADKEPTPDDTNADGTPRFKTYEEFSKALARWEVKQELAEQRRVDAQQAQAKEFSAAMAEAERRYENFAEIAEPFAGEILNDPSIDPMVTRMFRKSKVMPDVVFTIASNAKDRAEFLKMAKEDPDKAIRYIALTESLIVDELAGNSTPAPEVTPVKPKTQAPKPPSEVGGRAAAPPDALEAAAKANDFRSFKAEATRRQLAKLKS